MEAFIICLITANRERGLICGPVGANDDIISPCSEAWAWAKRRCNRVVRGVSGWTESLNWAFIHYEWAVRPSVPVCNSTLSLKWKKEGRVRLNTEGARETTERREREKDHGEVWATERNAFDLYTSLFVPVLFLSFFLNLFLSSVNVAMLAAWISSTNVGWVVKKEAMQITKVYRN